VELRGKNFPLKRRDFLWEYFRPEFLFGKKIAILNINMKKKIKSSQKVKFAEAEFFYDDCEICRAMKEAEKSGRDLTEDELIASFRKAREKGAVVGGGIFDKEE